jgi:hypothetical protein
VWFHVYNYTGKGRNEGEVHILQQVPCHLLHDLKGTMRVDRSKDMSVRVSTRFQRINVWKLQR